MRRKDAAIQVIAPGMNKAVPLALLMRVLGVSTEARMFDMVATHISSSLHSKLLEFLRPSFCEARKYANNTLDETLMVVWALIHGNNPDSVLPLDRTQMKTRLYALSKVIKENILPHLGDLAPKAHFIGSMIADMFLV
jgi:hypothetical protein